MQNQSILFAFQEVVRMAIEGGGVLLDLVGNLGALGLIFWLVWRTTNHTIPRLAKSFEDAMGTAREDFRDLMKNQREDFKEILEDQRGFFADRVSAEHEQIERIISVLRERGDITQNVSTGGGV